LGRKTISRVNGGGCNISFDEIEREAKDNFTEFPKHLISSDELEKMDIKWLQIETLPNSLKDGIYVVNARGEHWFNMIIQDDTIFIIDPLSIGQNPKDRPDHHTELIAWGKKHDFTRIYASEVIIQPKYSNLCGYVAAYLAKKIPLNNLTYKKLDSWLNKNFENKNNSTYNVEKILSWCNSVGLC
jgi:hypothetical protein